MTIYPGAGYPGQYGPDVEAEIVAVVATVTTSAPAPIVSVAVTIAAPVASASVAALAPVLAGSSVIVAALATVTTSAPAPVVAGIVPLPISGGVYGGGFLRLRDQQAPPVHVEIAAPVARCYVAAIAPTISATANVIAPPAFVWTRGVAPRVHGTASHVVAAGLNNITPFRVKMKRGFVVALASAKAGVK